MKNELIIKTRHMLSNEELMMHEEDVLRRFLRYATLDKIMNEIKENGMELLEQRMIDEPELNGQVYETNLVIMKTSEYRRLKEIEKELDRYKRRKRYEKNANII